MDEKLGWGDVLFLICAACYFPVIHQLFFIVLSLLIVVIIYGLWYWKDAKRGTIPLAGLQALMLGILLAGDWWGHWWNSMNDDWFFMMIDK